MLTVIGIDYSLPAICSEGDTMELGKITLEDKFTKLQEGDCAVGIIEIIKNRGINMFRVSGFLRAKFNATIDMMVT